MPKAFYMYHSLPLKQWLSSQLQRLVPGTLEHWDVATKSLNEYVIWFSFTAWPAGSYSTVRDICWHDKISSCTWNVIYIKNEATQRNENETHYTAAAWEYNSIVSKRLIKLRRNIWNNKTSIWSRLINFSLKHTVTCTPTARQRVGKRVPQHIFLINNALLGYATMEDVVFSMSSAPSNSRTVLCNPFLSNGTVNTSTIIGVSCGVCAECL
jgi:hypothetical protein